MRPGDACQVFSASAGRYVAGTVVALGEGEVRVRYTTPAGTREKMVSERQLRASLRESDAQTISVWSASAGNFVLASVVERRGEKWRVRYRAGGGARREKWVAAADVKLSPSREQSPMALAQDTAAAACGAAEEETVAVEFAVAVKFAPGDACQVFSASAGAWVQARVLELKAGEAHVRYKTSAGTREKWVAAQPSELRPAASPGLAARASSPLSPLGAVKAAGAEYFQADASGIATVAETARTVSAQEELTRLAAAEQAERDVEAVASYMAAAKEAAAARLELEVAHERFVQQTQAVSCGNTQLHLRACETEADCRRVVCRRRRKSRQRRSACSSRSRSRPPPPPCSTAAPPQSLPAANNRRSRRQMPSRLML